MKKTFLQFLSSTTYVTKPLLVQKASICKTVGTRCKKPLHLSGLDSLLATPKKLSSELTASVCGFQLKHVEYPKLLSRDDTFVSTGCLINCHLSEIKFMAYPLLCLVCCGGWNPCRVIRRICCVNKNNFNILL